ncbi:hypothetical protein J6Z39_01620 [bacterium]|nr:hypothetical protein [bacterium]
MKKNKVVIAVAVLAIICCIAFLANRTSKDTASKTQTERNIKAQQTLKKKQIADFEKALRKSLKPVDYEKIFNEKTNLEPLPFDELEKLEGEALQKRYEELDVKLDYAIQKNPDLPQIPEWYTRERDYVENKFFATVGKSRYKTELTEEQKEKRQKHLDYLEEIKKSGREISDEELAKTKEQILGE